MKKLLMTLSLIFGLFGLIRAGTWYDEIGAVEPLTYSTRTMTGLTSTWVPSITIPISAGTRNCYTEFSVHSIGRISVYFFEGPLTGGSTTFVISTSSGLPLVENWNPATPFCGDMNSTTTVRVINLDAATTIYMNLTGFKRNRP